MLETISFRIPAAVEPSVWWAICAENSEETLEAGGGASSLCSFRLSACNLVIGSGGGMGGSDGEAAMEQSRGGGQEESAKTEKKEEAEERRKKKKKLKRFEYL